MPRNTGKLQLREGDFEYLCSLIKQRTIQAQVVIRAHMLLDRDNGVSNYDVSTNKVRLCIDKYISGGTDSVLFDEQREGQSVEITDDAKSWVLNLASQKPCELGYSVELWTLSALINMYGKCRSCRVSAPCNSGQTLYTKITSNIRYQAFQD